MKKKICKDCNKEKNITEFVFKNRPYGKYPDNICKKCRNIQSNEWNKKAYKLNPEKYREKQRIYRLNNLEKIKQQKKKLNERNRLDALKIYGGNPPKCACCGELEIKFLEIDHINGGGTSERKKIGMGTTFVSYLKARNYPEGYQILCSNCNQAKGRYGICPHQENNK